ncbi:MAG: hypothetical protein Q4D98_07175 [Planctomycetia bacterium]|nr:hypothetical protein [Planctomycetia bacterium]
MRASARLPLVRAALLALARRKIHSRKVRLPVRATARLPLVRAALLALARRKIHKKRAFRKKHPLG